MTQDALPLPMPEPQRDEARARRLDAQIQELQKITDYEIREWPIEVLVDKFTRGRETDEAELFIPDYQREMVWSARQQSRFVESIMIHLPIPFIFAADVGSGPREGHLEVIDGSQRLRTLDNFLSDRLTLVDLKKLTDGNGLRFSDLSRTRQMRFKRQTVRVIELTEKADEEARREMFGRLNSGGTKLVSMEIRRGSHDGPLMRLVTELAALPLLQNLVPLGERNAKRKEYEEFVLRYLAYADNYQRFQKNVDDFLTGFLQRGNEMLDRATEQRYRDELGACLHFVQRHFPNGFKREKYTTVPRIRFEALAVGITLALRERPDLVPDDVRRWLDSSEFIKHTRSDASNSRPKLYNRLHYVRDNLLGRAVEYHEKTKEVEASANADAPEPEQDDFEF
jgi:hypothetical protein